MLLHKVNFNDVIMFFRQFAVMLKAGISISDSLHNLQKQNFSKSLKKILASICCDINSGELLSEAFSKHPRVFPRFFVDMVRIGEVSGELDKIVTSMADYYENDRKIKKKVSSAMVYPTLLVSMIFLVTIFLCLFVLPQFESTIVQLGGDIPKITVIVMSVSKFLQEHFIYIILVFLSISLFTLFFFNSKTGKYVKDAIILNLPIISTIHKNIITARFSKAFVILLGSGMNMVDILENLSKMLGNEVFTKKFVHAIEEVKHGKKIAISIEETNLFPQMLTEMILVGENSGNLEEVLTTTGDYFDTQVETSIAKAVAMIEPVAIVILGCVVSFVVFSVLIPIMSIMNAI